LFEENKTNVRGFICGKKHWAMMCPATLIYQGKFGAEKSQKVEGKGKAFFKITFLLAGYYFRPYRYNRPNLLVGEHDLLLGNITCGGPRRHV